MAPFGVLVNVLDVGHQAVLPGELVPADVALEVLHLHVQRFF